MSGSQHHIADDFMPMAERLFRRIDEEAAEFRKEGLKDAYTTAAVGIICAHLAKSIGRIERLEGDIKLLTDLLASVEEKR
ncbi:hypothetical protein [Azotobacter armeniacus]